MPGLVRDCDVILGNEESAEKVFGIQADGFEVTTSRVDPMAYESVGRQLLERSPRCRKSITTLRGSHSASHNTWTGVLWDGERLVKTRSYEITHIGDRVGGGDAFMSGLIHALCQGPSDDQRARDFAVAASALKHTGSGDFNLVTEREVERLMGGDGSGRVSR